MNKHDYVIIGAGVIGLACAYELSESDNSLNIAIIDKESKVAQHASGRNSGVIHAGIYYAQDSLKAKFCSEGNKSLRDFCKRYNIHVNECGKLIVAKNEQEHQRLSKLYQNARKNGASVSWLDKKEVTEIDDNVLTFEHAIWSPDTASIDPTQVCEKLQQLLLSRGVTFYMDTKVIGVDIKKNILTTTTKAIQFSKLINAAGLYADKIAHYYGFAKQYQMLPFKGYYLIADSSYCPLRTNVYPVPDEKYPFLGVHFTITSRGSVKVGPTAVPALWKEQYKLLQKFSMRELCEVGVWYCKSYLRNDFGFRDLVAKEAQYLFRKKLLDDAQKLTKMPLNSKGFVRSRPGIRAQLFDKEKKLLVNDFIIQQKDNTLHILNAVSPAFTCAFSVSKHIVKEYC